MLKLSTLGLCAILALATPALAHPHVFIEIKSSLVFGTDGAITGLSQSWLFDDAYAQTALEGLDTNKDGTYSPEEIAPLTSENMASLKEYNYFTLFRLNNVRQELGEVDDATAKQVWENGKLSLHFFVPLKTPIDPRKGETIAKIYDPDYFIAFDYEKSEPFTVNGTPPQNCNAVLIPLQTEEELQQTRDFLASKGQDWTPPEDQDFGEMFAQALTVKCANS
jgi:ABC-type uncharacterized transport system substrate-binding protein